MFRLRKARAERAASSMDVEPSAAAPVAAGVLPASFSTVRETRGHGRGPLAPRQTRGAKVAAANEDEENEEDEEDEEERILQQVVHTSTGQFKRVKHGEAGAGSKAGKSNERRHGRRSRSRGQLLF